MPHTMAATCHASTVTDTSQAVDSDSGVVHCSDDVEPVTRSAQRIAVSGGTAGEGRGGGRKLDMPWATTLSKRAAVKAHGAVALLYCSAMTKEMTPDDGALLPKLMLRSWRAKGLGTLRKALHDGVRTAVRPPPTTPSARCETGFQGGAAPADLLALGHVDPELLM